MTAEKGYFGQFGGSFVPEPIQALLDELEATFEHNTARTLTLSRNFDFIWKIICRPTPLYYAESLTSHLGGAKIYLKREDLNHLGSHKLTTSLRPNPPAKRTANPCHRLNGSGPTRGRHHAAAAKFGMKRDVHMGAEDVKRQRLNVFRMEMMGARVHGVTAGTATLKEAVDGLGAWMNDLDVGVLGSAVGPHPYLTIVHDFCYQPRVSPTNPDGSRLPDAASPVSAEAPMPSVPSLSILQMIMSPHWGGGCRTRRRYRQARCNYDYGTSVSSTMG
ncbi:MAG: pyridoxal-phosphate dependent enzyme [Streptococcus sp.]